MLAFQHMISAVRTSLRDLLETILVSMCLNGEVDRNRNDWSDITFRYDSTPDNCRTVYSPNIASLPLLSDNGAGLAIAVSTYFDEVKRHGKKKDETTPSEDTKEEVKSNCGWLPQVPNITKNLRNAFHLWDAVCFKDLSTVLLVMLMRFSGLRRIQGSR
jgi:Temperature dependent protein affecting M2 dsRNA replication